VQVVEASVNNAEAIPNQLICEDAKPQPLYKSESGVTHLFKILRGNLDVRVIKYNIQWDPPWMWGHQ
jgi:hypothetical protein